jgi:predicted HD phosphohydrolase
MPADSLGHACDADSTLAQTTDKNCLRVVPYLAQIHFDARATHIRGHERPLCQSGVRGYDHRKQMCSRSGQCVGDRQPELLRLRLSMVSVISASDIPS